MAEPQKSVRILHTSDWHIGARLNNRDRYDEHEAFLGWLANTIEQEQIDVLIVAGDVFDTSTPSNRAQHIYYNFLCRVMKTSCRHVVVVAGNHDSPTFLNAPQQVLKALNVHVVGQMTDTLDDEILVLMDTSHKPELIVCAAPYLRDRDIRTVEPGENADRKAQKLVQGIQQHYHDLAELAQNQRLAIGQDIPIVATGHLFAAGGQTLEGDVVRELYVGSLGHVGAEVFPDIFDYVALGHLHTPQKVHGVDTIRYSGAPLAMGFAEAQQAKNVLIVSFAGTQPTISAITVPRFRQMESICGNWSTISERIQQITNIPTNRLSTDSTDPPDAPTHRQLEPWLEVIYDSTTLMPDFAEKVKSLVEGSRLDVVRHRIKAIEAVALSQEHPLQSLDQLTPKDVFVRMLTMRQIPEAQQTELLASFQEVMHSLHEQDAQAE
jgi:DNA repair protein SbcD/Mre11